MIKNLRYIFMAVFCFIFLITNSYAYEYENPKNESNINSIISEIFDSKEMYEFLAGEEEIEEEVTYSDGLNSSYWWPIGSAETTEVNGKVFATGTPQTTAISSPYGKRTDPINGTTSFHSGIDIPSGGAASGVINVVAVNSGIVVYPTPSSKIDYGTDKSRKHYGNYVIIKHADGNYSLYGHLAPNTITVKEGDAVEQGQVIGKMGKSGYSTGVHLHFEIRVGQNNQSGAQNPLDYVSKEEPRKVTVTAGSQFIEFLHSWEGHEGISGDYYLVKNIGDRKRTVGYGITLENNAELFAKRGIDINDYPAGSKLPITLVDDVKKERVENDFNAVKTTLSKNGLTLKQNQIEALVSLKYQWGNINGFSNAYKTYGDTDALYQNYFAVRVSSDPDFTYGHKRRRAAEWELFHNGIYKKNE